jgi:hypothetical protein
MGTATGSGRIMSKPSGVDFPTCTTTTQHSSPRRRGRARCVLEFVIHSFVFKELRIHGRQRVVSKAPIETILRLLVSTCTCMVLSSSLKGRVYEAHPRFWVTYSLQMSHVPTITQRQVTCHLIKYYTLMNVLVVFYLSMDCSLFIVNTRAVPKY